MAKQMNRNERRASAVRARKGSPRAGNKSELIAQLTSAIAASRKSDPMDKEDDEEDADQVDGYSEKDDQDDETMSVADMVGGDDEDPTDVGTNDTDEDEPESKDVQQDDIDDILDALMGVDDNDDQAGDDEEMDAVDSASDDEDYHGMSVSKGKTAPVSGKVQAAAKRVLAALEADLEGQKLSPAIKRMLLKLAVSQKQQDIERLAEKKAARIKKERALKAEQERKSIEMDRQLVDQLVEEKLMNTRPNGRGMVFGGQLAGIKSAGGSFEGKAFDRNRASSINQNTKYRMGLEFKLVDAYRALVNPEFARKWAMEAKALGVGTGASGGYIVPQEWSNDFIDLLRAKSTVRKFARVYPMNELIMHLPAQTGAATAAWLGENSDIAAASATDQAFNDIVFTAKNLVAFSKVGNQLLADSTYGAEEIVREDLRKVVALLEDSTFLTGTGSATVPTSIYGSIPGGNKITGTGTSNALASDDIYSLLNLVEENNAQVDTFVTSATGLNRLRKLKDTTGNYIFSSAGGVNAPRILVEAPNGVDPMNYGPVGYILERPVYISTQITKTATIVTNAVTALTGGAATLLFAGQSDYAAIAQRAEIEIAASNVAGNSFQFNQTYFRAVLREDFQLTIPGAWAQLGFN